MARYYFEYGGGLGDIFARMSIGCSYNVLHSMVPDDTAEVALITHNPHSRELFDHHPKASQIKVRSFDYWWPRQDKEMRARHNLPYPAPRILPTTNDPVLRFYPAEPDKAPISEIEGRKYVAFSVSGSDTLRNFPLPVVRWLVKECVSIGLLPVFVGRTYTVKMEKAWNHFEIQPDDDRAVSLIDRLTVPGVACVVGGAVAAITCHSSIAVLAMALKKRQLMLYPGNVRNMIEQNQPRLQIDKDPGCDHACFADPVATDRAVKEFFSKLRAASEPGEQCGQMAVSS